MCGISGLLQYKGDWDKSIHAMNAHMKDRGPDAEGVWKSPDASVVFGHRRLAIVDLTESGAQPFVSAGGRYVMAYNGEIYDFKKLGQELIEAGHVTAFRSTSDTEVLIQAVETFGVKEALKKCKGMFAAGIYDRKMHRLHLVRDRVGEKPLYYGWVPNGDGSRAFAFASDIGCFPEIPEFPARIRRDVLDLYFTYGYIPAPYTIYEDVYKLEPGSILTLEEPYAPFAVPPCLTKDLQGPGWSYETYWSMRECAKYGRSHLFTGSREEASRELERLLKDAVRGQMVADVPLGAFLSAGIDSSTIVSLMQDIAPGKVRTFTIGMDDAAFDEAPIAEEIARHLGTQHTTMYISEEEAMEVVPKIAGIFGEPFADSSQIPTYLVSRMTREHVTVSLSGDAGDELFCGYRSYPSLERIWGKMKGVPLPVRRAASGLILHSPLASKEMLKIKGTLLRAGGPLELGRLQNEVEYGGGRISLYESSLKAREEYLPEFYLGEVNHDAMLRDLTMYHPDDILVKVDRTAMAVSLETRVPMLDRDVVEFAWTLPVSYLRDENQGKLVLRDILYRHVPKELMDRPKKGFSIPIRKWLTEGRLKEWAEALTEPLRIRQEGYLDPDTVTALWKDLTERKTYRPQLWYILMFQQWLEENRKRHGGY